MGITDHLTTCILLPFQRKNDQIEKIKISFRDCSTVNDITFENKLRNFNWNAIKSYDPDIYLQNFISSLNLLFQESYPLKTKFQMPAKIITIFTILILSHVNNILHIVIKLLILLENVKKISTWKALNVTLAI